MFNKHINKPTNASKSISSIAWVALAGVRTDSVCTETICATTISPEYAFINIYEIIKMNTRTNVAKINSYNGKKRRRVMISNA